MRSLKRVHITLRRCALIFAIAALPMLVSRNWVSRQIAERVANAVLKSPVSIRSAFVGWGTIEFTGITVVDPTNHSQQLLTIAKIHVRPSLFVGIQSGVWLDLIEVDRPTLHAHFDPQGRLLSQYPIPPASESDRGAVMPIRSIRVHDASVVLHQADQQTAIVAGSDLNAQFGTSIRIQARIAQFLGGQLDWTTEVDTATIAGQTSIKVHRCRLDANSLPAGLLPDSIRTEQYHATASLDSVILHPANANALGDHLAKLNLRINELQFGNLGALATEMELHANSGPDGIVMEITTDPLGGTSKFRIKATPPVVPISAMVESQTSNVHLAQLIQPFVKDLPIDLSAGLKSKSTLDWDGAVLKFSHQMVATAGEVVIDGVSVADIVGTIDCQGSIPVDANQSDPLSNLQGQLSGSVRTDGIDLTQIAKRIADPALQGRIAAAADMHLDLEKLTDPMKTIEVNASLKFADVAATGIHIPDTIGQLEIANGLATARLPSIEIIDQHAGSLCRATGQFHADLHQKTLSAEAQIDDVLVQRMLQVCRQPSDDCSGTFSGRIEAYSALDTMLNPASWTSTASIKAQQLVIAGEAIGDANVFCHLKESQLVVPKTMLRWRDNLCHFQAAGTLDQNLVVDADFHAGPIRLVDVSEIAATLSRQPLELQGLAQVHGNMHVDTAANDYRFSGTADLSDALYARTVIGSATLDWEFDRSGLQLRTESDDFLGGNYVAIAQMQHLDWTSASLELEFSALQCSRIPTMIGVRLPVQGTVDGAIKLTDVGQIDHLDGAGWIRANELSVGQVTVDAAEGHLTITNGATEITVSAQSMRGEFNANARTQLPDLLTFIMQQPSPAMALHQIPIYGNATLAGLSIADAARIVDNGGVLQPLAGALHATCVRDLSCQDEGLIGKASATLENVRWQGSSLTDRSTASLRLHSDRIELKSIEGRMAGGRMNGRAEVAFENQRGYFQFSIQRMNLRQATAPLGRIAKDVTGTANLQIDGRLGRVISGRAQISANHPSAANLNVRAARIPVDWSFVPATGRIAWNCRAGVIDAGTGKINLATEGDFTKTLTMRLTADIDHVDTSRILRGGSADLGILDGRVQLQSNHAHSLQQFTGNFDLNMSKIDSLELPILDQLDSFLHFGPTLTKQQDSDGVIQGRLTGGLVHLDRLTISQSNVQVLMDGHANMDGRLNFDVTAATGQSGPADGLSALASSPILLATPAPVALLVKANEAMKDRVVHVHVGGTANRPVLRLQPGKQLTQDTLRFFLTNSFGSQIANAVDTSRRDFQTR